ncbi:methionine--tRNA ligase [Aureibacillus halotolerans]|uniref:Methionine--tRNA ligase n=1 Tax=Aureibacillus halotolerans TaxID=1508390 RepID=A0A4R6UHL2_9BACI|nr:methionine--tRNA ligase [Aureibacillus halotolerans]TDQ42634.1 methionyl-tRNA synthetase [Aureibacillus halotolerans]
MTVFIGGAWPYANGSLHIGHVASLLPGDVLARFFRQCGEEVLYVSGSDCNGTPISIRARQEGVSTTEIADRFHEEFSTTFATLGFSYDVYSRTDCEQHHVVVQELFKELYDNGWIYEKETEQTYCINCAQFLPDRYVEGQCPSCGRQARGDQCDFCATILDPLDLLQKTCKLCGDVPETRKTTHLYLALSQWQRALETFVETAANEKRWRDNAIQLSKRYLHESLRDRAVSRDLPNGVPVPIEGFTTKKIYVWIEAVAGYLSASLKWEKTSGQSALPFWSEGAKAYYVHGKDNIPFHTIIWPALLMGTNRGDHPTHIISSEYMTLEKKKLSTSQNWAVWVKETLERYEPDSLRYYLLMNAPEQRDADFSWREFIYSHNSELLGAYGNFVNRTLIFIEKSYPEGLQHCQVGNGTLERITELYSQVGDCLEAGHCKKAIELIFHAIRDCNVYFDRREPWIQVRKEPTDAECTLATCLVWIANFAQLLAPFLPFSSEKVKQLLGLQEFNWFVIRHVPRLELSPEPLFSRIDLTRIDEERVRLEKRKL